MIRRVLFPGDWDEVMKVLQSSVPPRLALKGAIKYLSDEISYQFRGGAKEDDVKSLERKLKALRRLDDIYSSKDDVAFTGKHSRKRRKRGPDPD